MPGSQQILPVAQMRAAEDTLIEAGTSVEALMDRAGRGAAEWIWRIAARQRVTVLCGPETTAAMATSSRKPCMSAVATWPL